MEKSTIHPNESATADYIKQATHRFIRNESVDPLQDSVGYFEKDNHRIYGIPVDRQSCIDYSLLRNNILGKLGLPTHLKFSRIVGDSYPFKEPESTALMKFFSHYANSSLWISGLAGKAKVIRTADNSVAAYSSVDTNGLAFRYANEHPDMAERFVSTAVCKHTPKALIEWGDLAGEGRSILLLYNPNNPDGKSGVEFSGDRDLSNGLMNDKLLCLEGGMQSWWEMVEALKKGVRVIAVSNLKEASIQTEATRKNNDPIHDGKHFFSAARFLRYLQEELAEKGYEASVEDVRALKDRYFETHVLYNQGRGQDSKPLQIFNQAMEEFINTGLWKKLPNLTESYTFDATHQEIVPVGDHLRNIKTRKNAAGNSQNL